MAATTSETSLTGRLLSLRRLSRSQPGRGAARLSPAPAWDARPFNPVAGAPANDTFEKLSEIFWRPKLFAHFALTPDLQIVIRPLRKADNPTRIIGSLRAFYAF